MFTETNYYQHLHNHESNRRALEREVRRQRLVKAASGARQASRKLNERVMRFLSLFL